MGQQICPSGYLKITIDYSSATAGHSNEEHDPRDRRKFFFSLAKWKLLKTY